MNQQTFKVTLVAEEGSCWAFLRMGEDHKLHADDLDATGYELAEIVYLLGRTMEQIRKAHNSVAGGWGYVQQLR